MDELLCVIYSNSIFSGMEEDSLLVSPHIAPIIRAVSKLLLDLLVSLLSGCQYLLESAWEFLQFTNFEKYISKNGVAKNEAAELYKLFNLGISIGIAISLIIALFVLIFRQNGVETIRRFFSNIIVLAVVLLVLPSVFQIVNEQVFGDKSFLTANAKNTSSTIVFRHTIDYQYCYDTYLKKYFSEDGSELKKAYEKTIAQDISLKKLTNNIFAKNKAGDYVLARKNRFSTVIGKENSNNKNEKSLIKDLKNIDIRNFDLNQSISEDTKIKLFKKRVNDTGKDQLIGYAIGVDGLANPLTIYNSVSSAMLSFKNTVTDGTPLLTDLYGGIAGFGKSHYYRYRTDYLCCFIEMIANIFLYVGAAFALIKLTWELMVNRAIVGLVGSIDLTNGEKLRTVLTSILGVYFSFAFVGLTIKLYNGACTFVSQQLKVSNLAYVMIVLFLAIVALDGPNIVGKIFGVNVGMRGGATLLAAGIAGGYAAAGFGNRVASNTLTGRNILGNAVHRFNSGKGTRQAVRASRQEAKMAKKADKINSAKESAKRADEAARMAPKDASVNDFKDKLKQYHANKGIPIDKNDLSRMATCNKAKANKDDLLNNAAFMQAGAEALGSKPLTDNKALKNEMRAANSKSQKGNPAYDKNYYDAAVGEINGSGELGTRARENLKAIGNNAQSIMENSGDKYTGAKFQAFQEATKSVYPRAQDANRTATTEYVAKQAYATFSAPQVHQFAQSYATQNGRKNANLSDYEHVLKNNTEYGVLSGTSFSENDAQHIAPLVKSEIDSRKNLAGNNIKST